MKRIDTFYADYWKAKPTGRWRIVINAYDSERLQLEVRFPLFVKAPWPVTRWVDEGDCWIATTYEGDIQECFNGS